VTQNACNCVGYAGAVVALAAIDVSFKGQCILGIGRTGYRPHAGRRGQRMHPKSRKENMDGRRERYDCAIHALIGNSMNDVYNRLKYMPTILRTLCMASLGLGVIMPVLRAFRRATFKSLG
jgi:hypothetical protein